MHSQLLNRLPSKQQPSSMLLDFSDQMRRTGISKILRRFARIVQDHLIPSQIKQKKNVILIPALKQTSPSYLSISSAQTHLNKNDMFCDGYNFSLCVNDFSMVMSCLGILKKSKFLVYFNEIVSVQSLAVPRCRLPLQKERCSYNKSCLLYTSPSPRDRQKSRMPSSA